MKLCIIGLSHRTAPVSVREQFAFKDDDLARALRDLKQSLVLSKE